MQFLTPSVAYVWLILCALSAIGAHAESSSRKLEYRLPLPRDAFETTLPRLTLNHWVPDDGYKNIWAIDLLPLPVGTEVYAVTSGVIVGKDTDGDGIDDINDDDNTSCGHGLTIHGDDGLYYLYCHGNAYVPGVKLGTRVNAGQLILYSGTTGCGRACETPHLHLEIKAGHGREWESSTGYCAQRFLHALYSGNPQPPKKFPATNGDCRAS